MKNLTPTEASKAFEQEFLWILCLCGSEEDIDIFVHSFIIEHHRL